MNNKSLYFNIRSTEVALQLGISLISFRHTYSLCIVYVLHIKCEASSEDAYAKLVG